MARLHDSDIEHTVLGILNGDPRIDSTEIDVRVRNGVVHISGTIDSAAERQAVREDVEASPVFESVEYRLALRNYVERTDLELRESVKRALIRDITVDAREISVDAASEGVVTLRGRVDSYGQKTAAESVAWWTPGVTSVVNHLEVDRMADPPEE